MSWFSARESARKITHCCLDQAERGASQRFGCPLIDWMVIESDR